jgi:hypothetical protein
MFYHALNRTRILRAHTGEGSSARGASDSGSQFEPRGCRVCKRRPHGDLTALHDGSSEGRVVSERRDESVNGDGACRLAEDGDFVWIASELRDVPLDPF